MTAPAADVKAIFGKALELPSAADRAAYLDQACGGDAALRAEVEGLLQALEAAGPFLNRPGARKGETADHEGATPGTVVAGRYKLLEEIGAGGMGTVWVAEQTEPVRRKVAVKLVKAGMDSRHVLARFEAERQALALMDHPNIAKVLDGGTTEQGRPFFVMEYVKGVPLTTYCDEARLTVKERLELFVPVCQAVQHAHQKGIIHRDLKPSNILVCLYDGTPVPKVIDFGLAKALHQPLTEQTLHTGHGVLLGTPLYMSPEQAELNNLDVDTRTDVYALGVILYELLTGTTPLEKRRLKEAAWQEVVRLIKEEEPPKPSTRLSASKGSLPSVSAQRHTEPARLRRLVRGELDWIVMKALEKDRARRYPTANGLGRDVERYLAEEAVEACPPSAGYRVRKVARRYRKSLATAAAFLVLLLVAGALTTWQAVRVARAEHAAAEAAREAAEREREETMRQARVAQEVQEALNQAAALRDQAKWAEAQALVERAEALLEAGPGDAGLADRVQELRRELDQEARDRRMIQRLESIRLEQTRVKDGKFDVPGAGPQYEEAFREYGLDVRALPAEAAAARVRRSPLREELLAALFDWASRAQPAGPVREKLRAVADGADPDPWRRAAREAVDRQDGARLRELLRGEQALAQPPAVLAGLGAALVGRGLYEEAVLLLRQAQRRHPGDFWINHQLAFALHQMRPPRDEEAVGYYRAALALRPSSPGAHLNLGNSLRALGDLAGAVACYRQAVVLDPQYAGGFNNLGNVLSSQGDADGAIACYRRAVALDPKLAPAHANLGNLLRTRGELPGAIACYRQALALEPRSAQTHDHLGFALQAQGDLPGAIAAYRQAIALDPTYARTQNNLGSALARQRDWAGAVACFRKAVELKPKYALAHYNLGKALLGRGDPAGAVAAFRQAVALDPKHAEAHCELGLALKAQGELAAALAALQTGHELGAKRKDWPYPSAEWLACCAALVAAGSRPGASPPDAAGRARLRRQALDCLRADLARRRDQFASGKPADMAAVRDTMQRWQRLPDLAGVRDAAALAKLPADEREAWQKLWSDVAGLRTKAEAK
jgi:tetratricopeptide (TPR) repeat protein/predicted Ser/Thr protein kinase